MLRALAERPWTRGEAVTLSVRPEKMTIRGDRCAEENCLEGAVREVIYHGEMRRFRVELAEATSVMVARQNLGATGVPREQDRVWVCWNVRDGIVFKENHMRKAKLTPVSS